MRPHRGTTGYSLFELLMTVGLAALVFALGIPSFGRLAADQRLRVEADALFHAVHRARQESIVRRRVVTVCPSADGERCDPGGDWSAGWIVFANVGHRDLVERADDEALIARHRVDGSVRLAANRSGFSFRSTHSRATNGTVIVCDRAGRAAARAVVISYTGRPRVSRDDTRGRPYVCGD